jgi:hypothetical protein
MVEAIRSISGKLQVLSLIFTNWDMSGSSGMLASGNSLVAGEEGELTYGQEYRPLEGQGMRKVPDAAGPGLPNAPGLYSQAIEACSRSPLASGTVRSNTNQFRLTFHWVILERYPMEATVLSIHINSAWAGTYPAEISLLCSYIMDWVPYSGLIEDGRAFGIQPHCK